MERKQQNLPCVLKNASNEFRRRCLAKQAKGYIPLQVVYENGSKAPLGSSASLNEITSVVTRDILGAPSTSQDAAASALERLVRLLARQNIHDVGVATGGQIVGDSDGLFRTPLGIVTEDALVSARALLDRMAPLVASREFTQQSWSELLSQYLTLIPRDIGQRRPDPERLFPNATALQSELGLLDSLAGSLQMLNARRAQASAAAANPSVAAAAPPRLFNVSLRLVEVGELENAEAPSTAGALWPPGSIGATSAPSTGEVFINVRELFSASSRHARVHDAARLRLRRVFQLSHIPMDVAFNARTDAHAGINVGNVFRLWHGTRVGNLLSILRMGLVVPPASSPHVTGRLFGDGIYASDCSTKVRIVMGRAWTRTDNLCAPQALSYALGSAPGQRRSTLRTASSTGDDDDSESPSYFALLCDMAMGRVHHPSGRFGTLPAPGSDSTWARASDTSLNNDEMIVYKSSQVTPRWLCEFKMSGCD